MTRSLRRLATIIVFALGPFAFTSPGVAAERVALVIGNGNYQKVPTLPNPPRDAADIGRALERLNFKVTHLTDADAAEMRKAIVDFGRAAEGSEMAVVFYAGHGMEAGGENWLIPIDAELRSDTDVESEAVSLRSISLQVSKARQLGLVILDACRNNPFAAKMKRALATRAVTRGLAPTEPTDNVLVAYAARDGTTANDGEGRNSPFTTALLHNLETPGLEISFLFRNVRDEVMTATKREQQPFVYGSLSKEAIYLKPTAPVAAPATAAAVTPPTSTDDEQFWRAIRSSPVPGLYEDFLTRYPKSAHVEEARQRLRDLGSNQSGPTSLGSASPTATDVAALPQTSQIASHDPNSIGIEKLNSFTPADSERVASMGAKLQLKMPPFVFATTQTGTPNAYLRFVGIWSSERGWGRYGNGRHGMLIVTGVSEDGVARGYYLYGPSTSTSWQQGPAGYISFAEKISGDSFSFKTKTTIEAKLGIRNIMSLQSARTESGSEKSNVDFSPVWQLVRPDSPSKRPPAASGNNHSETKKRITAPVGNVPDKVVGQSIEERYRACRKLVKGFTRREACARTGVL
jgi:Caspase domain